MIVNDPFFIAHSEQLAAGAPARRADHLRYSRVRYSRRPDELRGRFLRMRTVCSASTSAEF